MKPYGLPRHDDVANPDVADIRTYGLASHVGRNPGPGGDCRGYNRNTRLKGEVRRYYKRRARAEGRREVQVQVQVQD